MPLIAKLVGTDAQLAGSGCDELVYLLVEALDAGGFKVDFRATRERRARRQARDVLVTGSDELIGRVTQELVKKARVIPLIADVSSRMPDATRAAMLTFAG